MNNEAIYLKNDLSKIVSLRFTSESKNKTGWQGSGSGTVSIDQPEEKVLIFNEQGRWKNENGNEFSFTNIYRWSFEQSSVKLEHLRFGNAQAVYLFHLKAKQKNFWVSDCPHKCDLDYYSAILNIEENQVVLKWDVVGPEKNEKIKYWYEIERNT